MLQEREILHHGVTGILVNCPHFAGFNYRVGTICHKDGGLICPEGQLIYLEAGFHLVCTGRTGRADMSG